MNGNQFFGYSKPNAYGYDCAAVSERHNYSCGRICVYLLKLCFQAFYWLKWILAWLCISTYFFCTYCNTKTELFFRSIGLPVIYSLPVVVTFPTIFLYFYHGWRQPTTESFIFPTTVINQKRIIEKKRNILWLYIDTLWERDFDWARLCFPRSAPLEATGKERSAHSHMLMNTNNINTV